MPNQSTVLDRVYQALADPTRRAVIQRLSRGPASVSELAKPFRMALPSLVKRWGADRVFNTSLFVSAAAFLAFPLLSSAPALAALALVLGLGMGCAQPVTLMLIYSRAPDGRSGEALGMRITINQVMHIAVPIVFGSLGTALGVAPVFFINSLILAGGGLLNRERGQQTHKQ